MISLLLCATFVVWVVYMVGRLSERIEQGPKIVKMHSDMAACQDDFGQKSLEAAACQRALLECQNADGRFAAYLERY